MNPRLYLNRKAARPTLTQTQRLALEGLLAAAIGAGLALLLWLAIPQ